MSSEQSPNLDHSNGSYPPRHLPRICLAWSIFILGWLTWWLGMLAPKIWGSSTAFIDILTTPLSFMLGSFMFGLWYLYHLVWPQVGDGSEVSPITVLFVAYLPIVLSLWWPVIMRSWRGLLWIWRMASVTMLFPWIAVYAMHVTRDKPPLHPGMILWAIGSTLIGISVWIAPPKIFGEPVCAITVLWRRWRKEPVLAHERKKLLRAFPVDRIGGPPSKLG